MHYQTKSGDDRRPGRPGTLLRETFLVPTSYCPDRHQKPVLDVQAQDCNNCIHVTNMVRSPLSVKQAMDCYPVRYLRYLCKIRDTI